MPQQEAWLQAVREQFQRNARANLLYEEVEAVLLLPERFLGALESFRRSTPSEESLSSAAAAAAQMCRQVVLALNPYLELDRGAMEELRGIYYATALRITEGADAVETA